MPIVGNTKRLGKLIIHLRPFCRDIDGKLCCRGICDCGREKLIPVYNIKKKNIRTCGSKGCKNSLRENHHGMGKTSTYNSWKALIDRCTCETSKDYKEYGARGITVCDRWLNFKNFLEDMGEKPTDDLQIERVDNSLGYAPNNCRWATRKEQARNRRSSRYIEFNGRTMLLIEWSEETGLNPQTILERFRMGWTIERTLTTPPRKYKV